MYFPCANLVVINELDRSVCRGEPGLITRYSGSRRWYAAGGYRLLEGGADISEVYKLVPFDYVLLPAGDRFRSMAEIMESEFFDASESRISTSLTSGFLTIHRPDLFQRHPLQIEYYFPCYVCFEVPTKNSYRCSRPIIRL